ncbi:MAG: hypothetical protein NT131_01895 [Methanomassiliicoccales archaeon]|nr:hypothetical protein [Methanomassiliicoccales archaeon]
MKTIMKTTMAIVMVMVMLGAFCLSAPSAAAANNIQHVVLKEDIEESFDIPSEVLELTDELFPNLIPYYDEWPEGMTATVKIDGKVHLNLKCSEQKDCLDVKVEGFFHGSIELWLNNEGQSEMVYSLDVKNLQIMAHLEMCDGDCLEQVIINAHMNADLASGYPDDIGLEPLNLDLSAHVIVHYMNGNFWVKIWLPEFLDLTL